MSGLTFEEIKKIQDKTTLKGTYLFFSISLLSYIFYYNGWLTSNNIIDPSNNLSQYIIFLTIASLFASFLYYMQLDSNLLKFWIMINGSFLNYRKIKNVKLWKSVNHLYIINERNHFISRGLFAASIFNLSLLLWKEELFILFIQIGVSIIFLSFLIEIVIVKNDFPITGLSIIFLLFYFSFTQYFHVGDPILFIFYLPISLLVLYLLIDWVSLKVRLKQIYFMNLFIQEQNLVKKKIVKQFVLSLSKGLWSESKIMLQQFLLDYLNSIVRLDNSYEVNDEDSSVKFSPKIKLIQTANNIEPVYSLVNEESFIESNIDVKLKAFFLERFNETFQFKNNQIIEVQFYFRRYLRDVIKLREFFEKLSIWDEWMVLCLLDLKKRTIKEILNKIKLLEKYVITLLNSIDEFRESYEEPKSLTTFSSFFDQFFNSYYELKKNINFNLPEELKRIITEIRACFLFLIKDLRMEEQTVKGDQSYIIRKPHSFFNYIRQNISIKIQKIRRRNYLKKEFKKLEDNRDNFNKNINLWVLNDTAINLAKAGSYTEADELYDKILEEDSQFATVYYNKACLEARRNDSKKALDYLRIAVGKSKHYCILARDDDAFKNLKENTDFQQIIDSILENPKITSI